MTREEAIAILSGAIKKPNTKDGYLGQAIDIAIKALEQEPKVWNLDDARDDFEDCVSRKAVDELSKSLVHTTRDKADFLCNFWERLQKLPSVKPTSNLDKIRAEIERYKSAIDNAISEDELKIEGMKEAYVDCLEIIDKYKEE